MAADNVNVIAYFTKGVTKRRARAISNPKTSEPVVVYCSLFHYYWLESSKEIEGESRVSVNVVKTCLVVELVSYIENVEVAFVNYCMNLEVLLKHPMFNAVVGSIHSTPIEQIYNISVVYMLCVNRLYTRAYSLLVRYMYV